MKKSGLLGVLLVVTMIACGAIPCWGQEASAAPDMAAAAQCKALANTDFSGIQDAPTQVDTSNFVEANGKDPASCQVEGYVVPHVGFKLILPTSSWNGNYFESGCGGSCGMLTWTWWCPKGYACLASDMGHTSGIRNEGLWALDLQANLDFGFRGAHVAALAGKAITARYYGKTPKHSYFMGCSTGGRQALVEAERFPWDFDGIVAAGPWIDDVYSSMYFVWGALALRGGTNGKPIVSRADLEMVHKAVIAKCDMDDGVKDGVVSYPPGCKFDPSELLCKDGKQTGCLTEAQADAIRKVYEGTRNSKGEKLYPHGAEVGTENDWVDTEHPLAFVWSDDRPVYCKADWAVQFFRYMVIPPMGSNWQLTDFDFDRDYKRFGSDIQETFLSAANPDLRKFKAAGGKIIIDQGWNDDGAVPAQTIDFYEEIERTMGGRASTEDFCRLFMVAGMRHCSGGDGGFAIDWVKYLDAWVGRGQAPEVIIGAHIPALNWEQSLKLKYPLDPATPISFTRPTYPYPIRAKYKGTGNPNDAANWKPVKPEDW